MKYIIWHDNDYDLGFWVYKNSILREHEVQLRCIPKTNTPGQITKYFKDECTKSVMQYIKFETPDIIIQKVSEEENNPVLCVTELMTHTPQWQHPAQRFTRIYTSSILRTPTALIIPQKKVKWERGAKKEYKETSYACSPSVYELFVQATQKNKTPTLIFNWPNHDGYLLYDQKHQTSPYITEDIEKWFKFINSCIIKNGYLEETDYIETYSKMKNQAEEKQITDFETIDGMYDTNEVIEKYNLDISKLSFDFKENEKTLIFKPNGLKCKSSKFRTDPYAGMLCAFDIMFCRDELFRRNVNLVLIAQNVKMNELNFIEESHELRECPFIDHKKELSSEHLETCCFTQAKYRRIYGEVADVIIFDDQIYYNRR